MKATFAAGCFWHVEEAFRKLDGVRSTQVGYMGGQMENPTYEDVCTDTTGHVEVCQVEYDPKIISFDKLLETFWRIHDPTQVNRQGWDIGTQYRSAIFYHNEDQKRIATASKEALEKSGKPVATKIEKAGDFYKAEDYHQKYLMKRGKDSCGI